MSQIIFVMSLGAFIGWFISSSTTINKSNLDTLTHMLLGALGSLIGLVLLNAYMHTTIGGRQLYALVLSLASSLVVIIIGRELTSNRSYLTKRRKLGK